MDIACQQPDTDLLICEYRLLDTTPLVSAAAEYEGIVLNADLTAESANNDTAILFLVDTSDPARDTVVRTNAAHIRRMLDFQQNHQHVGIASFDANLNLLCEIGCSTEALEEQLNNLTAQGKTTELYRNALQAIKEVKKPGAERMQVIIMSDGLAEDLAYHHDDVVAAAREHNVVISSVGYPRSVPQSIALQTLRRLSEETGGLFVQANHIDFAIPSAFFKRVMTNMDHTGRVKFDLTKLHDLEQRGTIELSLAFQTTEQSFLVLVPTQLPEIAPGIEKEQPAVNIRAESAETPAVAANPLPPVQVPRARETPWNWFWYGLPALVFTIILAIALTYTLVARRRTETKTSEAGTHLTPHAFLVLAENESERYKIDHTPWRIGRSRSSDLPLGHTSVSRLHAEIRRDALGQFTLQDLESLNGVFVNGEAIEMTHLEEQDRVEIGDVGFIFTLHDEDYAHQDATILIHTRKPQ